MPASKERQCGARRPQRHVGTSRSICARQRHLGRAGGGGRAPFLWDHQGGIIDAAKDAHCLPGWQAELEKLNACLVPSNARLAGLGIRAETKRVRFSQKYTRQRASLIALFDDVGCRPIAAESMRKDLELEASQRPTEPTQRSSKAIKAIIHLPQPPPS